MLYLHSFENPIHGKESQGQFPAGGTFSWRHCKARSVHFISCSFTDSVVPPLSCSGSGSSLSGIATSSYGSLSSRQASSIKSKILPSRCTSLSIFLQLWSRQFCASGSTGRPEPRANAWPPSEPGPLARKKFPYPQSAHRLPPGPAFLRGHVTRGALIPRMWLPKQRRFGDGGFVGRNTKSGA